jgi:hypothetical protein
VSYTAYRSEAKVLVNGDATQRSRMALGHSVRRYAATGIRGIKAEVLGVAHETIRRDLGTNVPPGDGNAQQDNGLGGTNVPPLT